MVASVAGRIRITSADRNHLNLVGTVWSTNFGLEILLDEEVDASDAQGALEVACRLAPRLRSRSRRDRWVPGPTPEVSVSDLGLDTLRSEFVDAPFDPAATAPLRVALSGRRLFMACMHGVCDTPGLVGFVGDMFTALAGGPRRRGHDQPVRPLLEREAWRPATLRALRDLRAVPSRHCTPFPASGAVVAESDAAVTVLSMTETRTAIAACGGTGPAGAAAEVLLARCLEHASPGEVATLFVPVNLRPASQRWHPAGNHLSHLLLHHEERVDAGVLAAEIRAGRGPARYAAPLERLAGELRRALERRDPLPEDPDLTAPVISINVNNMGRIDAGTVPGVEAMVFLGSNSPLYPVVSLMSAGERLSICARVRRHHGGSEVAEDLVVRVRRRLLG